MRKMHMIFLLSGKCSLFKLHRSKAPDGRSLHHRTDATSCGIKHIVIAVVDPRVSFIQSVLKLLDPDATALPFSGDKLSA